MYASKALVIPWLKKYAMYCGMPTSTFPTYTGGNNTVSYTNNKT